MTETASDTSAPTHPRRRRVRTPTLLQMEAVECGAASLGIILGHYGSMVPLEELREACDVSRDGTNANNVLKAARSYGMAAKGFFYEVEDVRHVAPPFIVFWNFDHFLVVEGFGRGKVYLNDPARGPRTVADEEFDRLYTGVTLVMSPTPEFKPRGIHRSLITALRRRVARAREAVPYVLLAALLLVLFQLVVPTFSRVYVDKYLRAGLTSWLGPLILAMAGVAAAMAVVAWLQQWSLIRMGQKLSLSTSGDFVRHLLMLPVSFFTQRFAGDLNARVDSNNKVANLISGQLAVNAAGTALIVFYVVLMARYDIPLTLVAIVVGSLNLVALRYVSRLRKDQNQKLLAERGRLIGTAMNGLRSIETLKAGGLESDFFARWSGQLAQVANAEQDLGVSTQMLSAVPVFLSGLASVLILTYGGVRVVDGALSIGILVAFQVLMTGFLLPLTGLVNLGRQVQEIQGDLARLDDVMRYPQDATFTTEITDSPTVLSGRIELRDVTFGYSRLKPPLIKDFNLTVEPGQRVALVGATGSGKSTVASLVTGLYEPWSGSVLFDGIPRQSIPRPIFTAAVSVASQDITLFEGTIKDNITMWDSTIPYADMVQAARDAQIHEDISARPGGYADLLEEEGTNFSGGQRQRVGIARALAGNPSILVLDEATSALDTVTEQMVDDNIRRRGCTCLIIAHRLSTIRDADEIIVLERGKVAERGTHDYLLSLEGTYARLMQVNEAADSVVDVGVPVL